MGWESYLITLAVLLVLVLWFTLQTHRRHRDDCRRLREAGGSVTFLQVVVSQARQVNVGSVLRTMAKLHEADIHDFTFDQLVNHWRSGVEIQVWGDAMIIARQHRLPITPDRIVELGHEGWDGWQVRLRVTVSVRYALQRLIPENLGNGPEVIQVKVGVAAILAVGRCPSAQMALKNPKLIIDAIRAAEPDSDSILMIEEIRLTHYELGQNIGEMLQAEALQKIREQGGADQDGAEQDDE